MATATRCKCARCTCRALMGPAVLITIGVLFLLGQVRGDLGFFEKTKSPRTWPRDRKSTRLNSSHANISYAVFCLKKKKKRTKQHEQDNVQKKRNNLNKQPVD